MPKALIPQKLRRLIKLQVYSGNTYHCPMCGYNSKSLYPLGHDFPILKEKEVVGSKRRDAGCHSCRSTDRDRLVFVFLKEKLQIFQNKKIKILHFAPENALSKVLHNTDFEEYICGDLFTEGYFYPDYVRNMNVLDIPFGENYFDLIICNHLLEHVPDDRAAMQELFRVLKPGGKAILQVPLSLNSELTDEDFTLTDPSEKEQRFGQFDHVRIYGQDYFDRLESEGFNVEKHHLYNEYPTYGLSKDEFIIQGGK